MITKEYAKGLAEVLAILDNTEIEYVNKIPKKILNFFRENASKDYLPSFNTNSDLKDMKLLNETKDILSAIYMSYWAETKEEKQQFNKIISDNQNFIDEEIREKYNPDKIFENQSENKVINPVKKDESMVVYKENSFQKIIFYIKKLIKRLFKK